jgi:hypothetical protein
MNKKQDSKMTKPCEIELKAKVIAFQEGLEPTEVVCPIKEFCKQENCVFIEGLCGDIYKFDEDNEKLKILRLELKKYIK